MKCHKYLKDLLPVEDDGLCLDFSVLNVHHVSGQDDRNVFANSNQITMPVGHVLVGDARCDVEHDDGTLALDVVPVTETTELLLTSCVPHVEPETNKLLRNRVWVRAPKLKHRNHVKQQ